MNIDRNISKDGNLLPSITNIIEGIPDNFIYNSSYYLRPPKIILNISFQRIFKAFENTLNQEHEIRSTLKNNKSVSNEKFDLLSSSLIELFEAINSYIEDCLHIFKATTPYSSRTKSIKEKFVHKWLKKAKHPTSPTFYESIKDYKEEITYYVNEFKHQHGRIDVIVGEVNNEYALGYTMKFVGDTPNGPQETLDLNEIKSILINLSYHFFQFYKISSSFKTELVKSIEFFHNRKLHPIKVEKDIPELKSILQKLQFDNLIIFPNNEFFTPKVYIDSGLEYLKMSYPVGITKDNVKYLSVAKIRGRTYPNHQLLIVPYANTIELIKNIKIDETLKLPLDQGDYFLKLFFNYESYSEPDCNYSYWEINYDGMFKLRTYTNIEIHINFEPGMQTFVHIKKINVEYLGITAKFGDLTLREFKQNSNQH